MRHAILPICATLLATTPAIAADTAAAKLDAAIASPHRPDAQRARDPYRHPKETLLFFGLRPDMTVVEIAPGAGWYSEILAPFLKGGGHYIAAHNDPAGPEGAQKQRAAFIARMEAHPDHYGKVTVSSFGRGVDAPVAAPGSADMVLTFRNVHNWISSDFAAQAFRIFFAALKPGGVLGVVDHRLPEDRSQPASGGYLKESAVIALAEAAGFRLDARSDVNANPKDSADWPKGVWTLPPTLTLGDENREHYLAIGESDRMTLRFVKPAP